MSSKYTLNVSLTSELREFVARQVASGKFRTASEVVRDALRRTEQLAPPLTEAERRSRQRARAPRKTQAQ